MFSEGSPPNAIEIEDSVAATLVVEHSGADFCTQDFRVLPFDGKIADGRGAVYLILYREFSGFPPETGVDDPEFRGTIVPIQ